MDVPPKGFRRLSEQYRWYRSRYSLLGLLAASANKFVNRWIITSKYLFVVDLKDYVSRTTTTTQVRVQSYTDIRRIPQDELAQLSALMGPGRAQPFLEHFFGYGAHLWVARLDERVVGIKWTVRGGLRGFYCIPIGDREVVSLAEQVFRPYRGLGVWAQMTDAILPRLAEEGITRVYFGVHCRNTPMLRAVKKAEIQSVGRVRTFRCLGWQVSIWASRHLWGGARNHGPSSANIAPDQGS